MTPDGFSNGYEKNPFSACWLTCNNWLFHSPKNGLIVVCAKAQRAKSTFCAQIFHCLPQGLKAAQIAIVDHKSALIFH